MASYPPPPPPKGFDSEGQRRYYADNAQAAAQREAFRAAQAEAQRAALRSQRKFMRYQMRGMRRGSVLGPILLIAVGVLFLMIQTGRLNHDLFWSWYGHWWPLLLVLAGVVLLAEWAFDQFHMRDPDRPPYRRSIGGGVITVLLILGVVGVVGHHIASGERWDNGAWHFDQENLDELLGDKHESDQMLQTGFPAGGSITVVNHRGDVTVSGTSDDNQVHIAVHKQVFARTDSDAASKAQQLGPTFTTQGTSVFVTAPSMEGGRADLVITVPASATTSITADRGDIHVASIKAAVFATANHGDIELSAITGQASAHVNSGGSSVSAHSMGGGIAILGRGQDVTLSDITGPVTISGEYFGTTHFEHIHGSIRFHTSRTELQAARLDGEAEISPHSDLSMDQALGPVILNTSNRNISLDRIAGDVTVTDRNGTIELTAAPPLGNVTLENRNGSVNIVLPERAGFSVEGNTTNGGIDTSFPLSTSGGENHKNINGSVGGGGPLVHITTTNGDISIHKGTVMGLTPATSPKLTIVPPAVPAPPTPPTHKVKSKSVTVDVP